MTKLTSWNVNGIRAVIKKGFINFVESYNPDILCIQETKARPEQVDLNLPEYPYKYWNWAEKKGYSGTAIFSKIPPKNITNGLNNSKHNLKKNKDIQLDNFILLTTLKNNQTESSLLL